MKRKEARKNTKWFGWGRKLDEDEEEENRRKNKGRKMLKRNYTRENYLELYMRKLFGWKEIWTRTRRKKTEEKNNVR